MIRFYFLLFLTVLSQTSRAAWSEDFESLKTISRSYEDTGSICEELARLEMKKTFPSPQYEVLTGLAYETEARVLGELDLVIFDNQTQKVVKIGEVKCWKDVSAALLKAHEQRARFLKALKSSKPIQFRFTASGEAFDSKAIDAVTEFFSIAQKGAMNLGFDSEINYSLKELRDYRYEMLRCQSLGLCLKP